VSLRWDTKGATDLIRRFPREAAKELRFGMGRIGESYRRKMFDRFKAPVGGPPFYRNLSENLLKSRSGGLRATVGYENAKASTIAGLRLTLYVGDAETARRIKIHEHGGVIRAKKRFLTLPLPDNLTAAGVPRFPSAKALFEQQPDRVWIQVMHGVPIIRYKPLNPLFGKEVLNLWALKASVRLKPRLGFRDLVKQSAPERAKELRASVAKAIRTVRAAQQSRASGKGQAF